MDSLLTKMIFWNTKTCIDKSGYDDAEWILEGNSNNKYHLVNRWSPDYSVFSKCCLFLLSLTDLEIKDDDIY